MKKGMIRVSVMYPSGEGKAFNMDYYCNEHASLVKSLLGNALKAFHVDQGVAGGTPGAPALYMAVGHLFFDSIEEFQNSFGPNLEKFVADLPNFTNAEPLVQINVVMLW